MCRLAISHSRDWPEAKIKSETLHLAETVTGDLDTSFAFWIGHPLQSELVLSDIASFLLPRDNGTASRFIW